MSSSSRSGFFRSIFLLRNAAQNLKEIQLEAFESRQGSEESQDQDLEQGLRKSGSKPVELSPIWGFFSLRMSSILKEAKSLRN